ncbi:MAG: tricorn protease [Fimbriimonadaceae bacterium]|nr:tricorn protease [Fimbriimonadaceae bacterium]
MDPANYSSLYSGAPGTFFAFTVDPIPTVTSQPQTALIKFDINERKAMPFASGVRFAAISSDGQKALLLTGQSWNMVSTAAPPAPGQGTLNLASMTMKVNPRDEWKQMYHEAWRIERDFFYAPNFHGQDLGKLEKRYEPFLDGLMSRSDLNYLFTDMLGEISVGHMFINGGDMPAVRHVPIGLLGADYSLENGRYRFSRVYNGENWNPDLQAPLTQPGVNVVAGEYLLEVDGKNITSEDNVNEALEATAGRQVRLKVGPNANGKGSREVVVVPISDEFGLRNKAWEEDNRRKVEEMSGGRLGYVHIPDTNVGGWTNFNRYYYAQTGKEGMIIDERFNHGGQVDDYMVSQMARPLMSYWTPRHGKDITSPLANVFGPKVMIINQYSGSGGDYFPWVFRQYKLGPIVGHRTWGGLVGILVFPSFIDGGGVTAPNIAFRQLDGKFGIENVGVAPDIAVDLDPYLWRQGRDAQLEAAVQEGMKLLEKVPKRPYVPPVYPDRSKIGG